MAKKKNSLYSTFGFRLLLLTSVVAVSLWGVKSLVSDYTSGNVLGTTTLLAERGSNSSSDSEVKIEDENDTPEPTEVESKDEDENEVEDENETEEETEKEEERTTSEFSLNNLRELQVRTEGNKTKIRLDSRGGSFELENEDGKLKIKAKEKDGREFELESETIDDINEALEEEGIRVATAAGNTIRIRRGLFEAETHFPLSINPTTNTLTVTTPAGTKDVAVLPDQAVNNLIKLRYINVVASTSANTGIVLGLFDNESAFQVKGAANEKLFGLFPVTIDKTAYVSAENGQVLKINQSFLSKLLDLLSIQ